MSKLKIEPIQRRIIQLRQRAEHHPLLTILLFSFLIRIFYLSFQNPLWWDSYIYVGMGKFLLSQGNAGLFEVFRPPLHPLLLGMIWKAGINPIIAGIVLDVLFSLLIVYLTYRIGALVFNQKTAFLAAFLTSITPVFLMHTGLILTEPLAMALSLTAIYLFIKNRSLILTGILIGLSVLAKFPQGIVFPIFVLTIFVRQKRISEKIKETILLTGGFLLVLLTYGYLNQLYLGNPLAPLKAGAWIVTTATWLYGSGVSYYFIHFFLMYPLFLFFGGYIYLFVKDSIQNKRIDNPYSFLLLSLCLVTIGYFLTVPRKEPRYLVVIVPYLALLSIETARRIYHWLCQQERPAFSPASFVIVCVALSIIFIPGPLSFEKTIYPEELREQLTEITTQLPIISSNPLPTAYADNKVVPLGNMEFASAVYAENKKSASLLLLTDCDLICPPDDHLCQRQKEEFIQSVDKENQLIFHKTIKSCTTSFYDLKKEKE